MKKLLLLLLFLAVTTSLLFGQGIGWSLVNAKIQSEFPDVPRSQTSELARLLSDPGKEKSLLRTKAEFESVKLRDAAYTHVTNLEGSIFRWADENRPLVHDGQPADKVHPYNQLWGMLLEKAHRAKNPPRAEPASKTK